MKKDNFIRSVETLKKTTEEVSGMEDYLGEKVTDLLYSLESEIIRIITEEMGLEKNEYVGTELEWYIYETKFGEVNTTITEEIDGKERKYNVVTPEDLWNHIKNNK
jgi:anion-transporting  ArsA/GET3 family ATPase